MTAINMKKQRGRRRKGYIKIYSSVPLPTYSSIEQEADRRGLDMADIIREVLIEKFGQEDRAEKLKAI